MIKFMLTRSGLFFEKLTEKGSELVDATGYAHHALFHPVELGTGVRLQDIFELIAKNPLLQEIFTQEFVKDYLKSYELFKLTPANLQVPAEDIDYLEVTFSPINDSNLGLLMGLDIPQLQAISAPLKVPQYGYKVGQRIPKTISAIQFSELLPLPVVLNEAIAVVEGDMHSKKYMQILFKSGMTPTLGTLLKSILWELSQYGAPDKREEAVFALVHTSACISEEIANMDLDELENEIDENAISTYNNFEELFGLKDPIMHFFDVHGTYSRFKIQMFVGDLDDDVSMKEVDIPKELNVSLKEKFKKLKARDLREEISLFECK